ncbi:MAG: TolC family protein, partial [Candidatus Firestonebacteria bacterium]|nr:TolC family protein [Candidatus Firestonebacteria bacterium]
HQDLLTSQRQLQQAGNALAATLRDLFNLTCGGAGLDFSRPWGADLAKSMPSDLETPTLWLTLDPLETALQRFKASADGNFNSRLPQIQMLADLAAMTRAYAAALGAGHWPKIQASAKSSWDYPDGPVLERVQQNTLAVNGSLSLFEFGRIRAQTAEQDQLAQAVDWQRESSLRNLQVSWQKAYDQITELKAEELLDQQAVSETEALAQLVYEAYRAGRSGYLEVQSVNFRALGAKIQAVRTHVQMLIQLALLDSLSENEVK